MGLLQWLRDKAAAPVAATVAWVLNPVVTVVSDSAKFVTSMYTGTIKTYHEANVAIKELLVYLRTGDNRARLTNGLEQWWQGFSRILYFPMHVLLLPVFWPKTLRTLLIANWAVVKRLFRISMYSTVVRPVLVHAVDRLTGVAADTAVELVSNATVAGDAASTVVCITKAAAPSVSGWLVQVTVVGMADWVAACFFTRDMVTAKLVDTPFYYGAVHYASDIESRQNVSGKNPLLQDCKCGPVASYRATISNSANNLINTIFFFVANHIPNPYRILLVTTPEALSIGRSFLAGAINAAGNCPEHQQEVLDRNHPYASGLGMSYMVAAYLLDRYFLSYFPIPSARDNIFVSAELHTSLSLYFIVLVNLSRNLPLPGDKPSTNYFLPVQKATELLGDAVKTRLTAQFKTYEDKKKQKKGEHKNWVVTGWDKAREYWHSRPARWARALLFKNAPESLHDFANRVSVRTYLELTQEANVAGVTALIDKRDETTTKVANWLFFIPIGDDNRKGLDLLMQKGMRHVLVGFRDFLRNPFGVPGAVAAVPDAKNGTLSMMGLLDDDEENEFESLPPPLPRVATANMTRAGSVEGDASVVPAPRPRSSTGRTIQATSAGATDRAPSILDEMATSGVSPVQRKNSKIVSASVSPTDKTDAGPGRKSKRGATSFIRTAPGVLPQGAQLAPAAVSTSVALPLAVLPPLELLPVVEPAGETKKLSDERRKGVEVILGFEVAAVEAASAAVAPAPAPAPNPAARALDPAPKAKKPGVEALSFGSMLEDDDDTGSQLFKPRKK